MSAVVGEPSRNELGKAICEAMGLDSSKVTGINIDLAVGKAGVVTVTYFANAAELGKVASVIAEYRLVAKGVA